MTLNQSAESDIHPVIALFDVDGTLVRSGGAARGALERAMEKLFGIASRPEIIWDGKTDPQIVRELMTAAGIANSGENGLSPLFEEYLQSLKQAISESPDRIRLYPGVLTLLEELDTRTDVVVGLLTGNIEAGARLKLEAAGAGWERFKVGSFGSDHADRAQLASIASRRAGDLLRTEVKSERIVVIGDTPHDISCGQSIGARTIGVGTGRYSVSELLSAGADSAFENLADTQRILAAILNQSVYFSPND